MFGLLSDSLKAWRQNNNGNRVSAAYTLAGGLTMAAGSAVVLEAGLAVAGVTSVVPFAGWAAAALVLAGAAVIAGGLYLHAKSHERVHTPIELWAARSIFGNRINDGEVRSGIALDHEKKLPKFSTLHAEIRAWNNKHYGAKLLSAEQALSLGVSRIDTKWHQNNHWAPPNWTSITHNEVAVAQPTAEFAVLLPGFAIGTSEWSGSLSSSREDKGIDVFPIEPTGHIVPAGLVLHFKKALTTQNHILLHLAYTPNHALDENSEINSTFCLEQ